MNESNLKSEITLIEKQRKRIQKTILRFCSLIFQFRLWIYCFTAFKLTSPPIRWEAVQLPPPNVLKTASHDPQTVCDAVETGHEEPEAPDEGNSEGHSLQTHSVRLMTCVFASECSSAVINMVPLEESSSFCGRVRLCHTQDSAHCFTSSSVPLSQTGLTAHHSSHFSR